MEKISKNIEREFDESKINLAKNNNYDVLVVWENDFRKSPQKIIKKCKEFLND